MTSPIDSKWYPECHLDEVMPPGRDSATAWIAGWQGDTLATCVVEMISLLRESEAEPGDYAASFYTYVDTGPWRFVAASRTFEQVQS